MSSNAAATTARIAIVMGSKSDWATMQFAAEILTRWTSPSMLKWFLLTVRQISCSALLKPLPIMATR